MCVCMCVFVCFCAYFLFFIIISIIIIVPFSFRVIDWLGKTVFGLPVMYKVEQKIKKIFVPLWNKSFCS